VEHPLAGTRTVFLKTACDTHGELLELDVFMRGGGRVSQPSTSTPTRRSASRSSQAQLTSACAVESVTLA
jgi:hypothetical protein